MKKITILGLFVVLLFGLSLAFTTEAQANNNSVILICQGPGANTPNVQGANGAGPKGEEAVEGDKGDECSVAEGKLDCCDDGEDCWECMAQLRDFGFMLVGQSALPDRMTYTYED